MPDQPQSDAFPASWLDRTDDLAGETLLDVAGYPIRLTITADALRCVYFPLLHQLHRRAKKQQCRPVVALAGIPGSGKSTFTAALTVVADRLFSPRYLVAVGMDG